MSFKPRYEKGFRVTILENAEKMTQEAQNSFLKILEEPPKNVVFILVAGNPQGLLPTCLLYTSGVGKTTLLREVARVLSDEFHKRVVIVDTSNEIAGDGDIPHPAIGRARRMQVPTPQRQADVMIEAVENHMPEVIVIDEIGTEAEAQAARTIAERGVQLIGTAHGNTLENLVLNPTLSDLVEMCIRDRCRSDVCVIAGKVL